MYKICRTEKSLARQRELEKGFLDYLENNSFFDMEVAELCRYLNIPRKTFYRYFGTKEDTLFALIDHKLLDMDQYNFRINGPKPSLRQDAVSYFTFWKEERRFLDILKKNHLLGYLFVRINTQEVAEMREEFFQSHGLTISNLYVYNFHMSGNLSLIIRWYDSGFQKTISEMADLMEVIYSTPLDVQFQYAQ